MRKRELPRSILIILLDKPEEMLISSPLIHAIKQTHPNSKIYYLTTQAFEGIAESINGVDKVFVSANSPQQTSTISRIKQSLSSLRKIHPKLKQDEFELCIDLQGTFFSGILAALSLAKQKISLANKGMNSIFMSKIISRPSASTKQIGADYRYLMDQLGIKYQNWSIQPPKSDDKNTQIHKPGDDSYVVLCVGANTKQKSWDNEKWQQISLRIRGRYQLKCLIIGFNSQQEQCDKIAKACGAKNLSGKVSLEEANNILSGAELVIGTDNYFTHAAVAQKIPTLTLFGPTCPYTYTDSESCKVVYNYKSCSPCGKKPSCGGEFHCMGDITPDMVLTEIKPLLKLNKNRISTR